jgi:hypothetical protein
MKRIEHQSLIPRWVERFALVGRNMRRHLYSRTFTVVTDVVGLYIMPMAFIGVTAMGIWFLAMILDPHGTVLLATRSPRTGDVSLQPWVKSIGYSILSVIILVPVILHLMRNRALHWINTEWKRITSEPNFEEYFDIQGSKKNAMQETLASIALRASRQEIGIDQFHLARDIAAMYGLCDKELRMRDLVKNLRVVR